VNDFRTQFQPRFVSIADDRLRRALATLATEPAVVYKELHALAGEAAIMGFTDVSTAASSAVEIARAWREAPPTREQQLACARILRSLMMMISKLAPAPAPGAAPAAGPASRRALVIDDSELTADEVANALREASFEVATAATIEAVVAKLEVAPVEIALVDANIPGVDIKVLCDRIRFHAPQARLLIVSAAGDDELRTFANHVGAHGFAGKMHGIQAIVRAARALLGDAS